MIPFRIEGWKTKKKGNVEYYQCPNCEVLLGTSPVMNMDYTLVCPACERRVEYKNLKRTSQKIEIATCAVCETETPFTKSYYDQSGNSYRKYYYCPKCLNVVGLDFKGRTYQPKDVLKVNWNKRMLRKAKRIDDGLFFYTCERPKDIVPVRLMQDLARSEPDIGSFFRHIDPDFQYAGLMFSEDKIKGYVEWSIQNSKALMNQIYILKEERNKGYGTKLTKFWIDEIAKKINDTFIVESPNDKSAKILEKLGHAKRKGNQIIGIDCTSVCLG